MSAGFRFCFFLFFFIHLSTEKLTHLSLGRQREGRDVGALPPASLGRRLPGRALRADSGEEQHHPASEYDYTLAFTAHHPDNLRAAEDAPHSSTRNL